MLDSVMMKTVLPGLVTGMLLLAPAYAADGHGHGDHHEHAHDAKAATDVTSLHVYPLATDPVTGEPLGDSPVIIEHVGRELRFANEQNVQAFRDDPVPVLAKVDQQIIEQQLPTYAADSCPVSGGKLGAMGEPVKRVYGNQLVQFCCAGCVGQFEKNTQQNVAKLNQQTLDQQRESYPMQTCVVSGEPLQAMGEPVEILANGQLVRFCCEGCVADFQKNPAAHLSKLNAARSKQNHDAPQEHHGHHAH